MKVLIRNAVILAPGSRFDQKKRNILIENGVVRYIGTGVEDAPHVVEGSSLFVTPGWCDMSALFGDPGLEHKEDLSSGLECAAHGGFTEVGILPNTDPVIASKNDIHYIRNAGSKALTRTLPYAAVTKETKGEDLTDMIDLHHAGAVAFTDGVAPIVKSDIVMKTLLYLQKMEGLLIVKPEDYHLNLFGTMHEGEVSTMLGMKGMPAIAEAIVIARDLRLLEYTGGKIHFSNISAAESVKLIQRAKRKGLEVTCDVAAHQLVLTDEMLTGFDTNFKVNPPLRGKKDRKALLRGIEDGTIDAIVSAHRPHDEECKKLEFDLADFGIIALQTVLPNLVSISEEVPLTKLIPLVTTNPRKILNLDQPSMEVGATANLMVFDSDASWTLNADTSKSKAENSPWWGQTLTGNVRATFGNKKQVLR